ncbi:class I SAM-dependent methyltransferase [Streptomyces sp. URMC 129]|uniref:class I SAM-dependent methyltransferase n=1 Tax=Streptomyces sp. URMC 129 TaxID=3423407 RepID=UPI003F1C8344
MPTADPYALSAPYIDPLIAGFWQEMSGPLTAELRALTARSGPVVDVGAGSGRGVRLVRSALPGVPVLAVEPSPALRTALFARLMDDPGACRDVTVIAAGAEEFDMPPGLRGLLAFNVMGHLPPPERRRLWQRIATCLAPGGAAFVNNLPPHTATAVPPSRGGAFRAGDLRHEGWAEAEPAGEDCLTWHMTYTTLRDGRCVSSIRVDYHWWVVTEEELRAEWAAHGLRARTAGEGHAAFFVLEAHGG